MCVTIADSIAALQPDLIVLSTPHGVGMCSTIGVYQPSASSASKLTAACGTADWNGEWTEYGVECAIDSLSAHSLLTHFHRTAQLYHTTLKRPFPNSEGLLLFGGA